MEAVHPSFVPSMRIPTASQYACLGACTMGRDVSCAESRVTIHAKTHAWNLAPIFGLVRKDHTP